MTERCFHCQTACGDDDYCFGCKTYVCERCSPYYDGPGGAHAPEEHLLYFEPLSEGTFTCRWKVEVNPTRMCGAPAFRSAYCVPHLHVSIDLLAKRGAPS